MATPQEPDFPKGHPARFDYDPNSAEAKEWRRINVHPKGERDFPVGHPGSIDTPGNKNSVEHVAGIDPAHPEREAFTGRDPKVAARIHEIEREDARTARETLLPPPTEAPAPPPAPRAGRPSGQPGD